MERPNTLMDINCLICDNSYTSSDDFDKHTCIRIIYSCDSCKVKLKRQLTRHKVKKHSIERPCNWCAVNFTTSPKQMYYCDKCKAKCVKESKRCHLPFTDLKYFELDSKRCNACQRKYLKEKKNGEWDSWFGRFYLGENEDF